ncbi:hypothetical protein RKE29_06960 [Streptomyces sp. B1866]|uniref:hypothetical protein n=1 Tax=Streptomyces sp. B1866 TaxID=3075431 RepID=UPI0028914972|nr:hypothetical protein [Streptomyces sp. B1866]MDT3396381.1 hypothetical protein [Streptomyces sp. B1866]
MDAADRDRTAARRRVVAAAAGGGWVSVQCEAARGGIAEAHRMCREGRCACRCHRKYAASLGQLIGGPEPVTGGDPAEAQAIRAAPPGADRRTAERRWTPPVTAQEARVEMVAAGWEPIEPYPGRASRGWSCRCLTCGSGRRLKLSEVRGGLRCYHRRAASAPVAAPVAPGPYRPRGGPAAPAP